MARDKKLDQVVTRLLGSREARVAAVRNSHYLFFHIYFNHYVAYETAPFQREVFALTEDDKLKLCVLVAFRESGKSTIVATSYPLWAILGRQQKKFVLLLSQTQVKAQQQLRNIKHELENNEVLKNDLGPFQEEADQWGVTALVFKQFNAKVAIGSVEQSIRGVRHLQYRPDLIILDDIEDTASVKTQEGRDRVWEWFTGEIIPAGTGATRIIAVGNLLHKDSLLKRLEAHIASEGGGIYREYPITDRAGSPLWPGKFPDAASVEAERKKIMDRVAWHREYLLEIVSDDDQLVLPEWISYYDRLPEEFPRHTILSIDPAISEKQGADCTAMVAAHIYGHRDKLRIYVLPTVVNAHLTFNKTLMKAQEIAGSLGQGRRATILVEDVQYQKALYQELKRYSYSAQAFRVGGMDKRARLVSVTHLFETGKICFPRTKSAEALVAQLLGFGVEKHDDLVDALTMLCNYALVNDRTDLAGISERPDRI
jgi:predicted phage terminase large subunit-like protein